LVCVTVDLTFCHRAPGNGQSAMKTCAAHVQVARVALTTVCEDAASDIQLILAMFDRCNQIPGAE
jgi:hypothetical protein